MKKIFLLIVIYLFIGLVLSAQNNLSGIYYSESGVQLKIENERFRLIMPNNARNGWYSEIMAEGIVKQIDNSFIELNSLPIPYMEVLESMKIIEKSMDSISHDSIKVKLRIPRQIGELKISISTDLFKNYDFNYTKNNQEIKIPSNVREISIYIEPEYIIPHNPEGQFFGLLSFSFIQHEILQGVNFIEIELPAIDDSFFERYYIKGDYARIVKDTIIWKGDVYTKSKG